MSNQKQNGFVLIITLFFIQLCTLLSLYMLQGSWIDNKLSMMTKAQQVLTIAIEDQFNQIEKEAENNLPACLIDLMLTDELEEKPLTWWEQYGCMGYSELMHYYYVIEPLTVDECAEIKQEKNLVAHYYRLTFMSLNKNGGNKTVLQSVFIKAVSSVTLCEKIHRQVERGRQWWRDV